MTASLQKKLVITIDGPAGSGKSTVAAALAGRLGIAYLDTGAMYRAVTYAALERGVPCGDAAALIELARKCTVQFVHTPAGDRVLLDGRDVTRAIRSPRVTDNAHFVAGQPEVRRILVDQQRRIARQVGALVTEGRDQGTVAFPGADIKFYLDASPECRARRRWLQIRRDDPSVTLEEVRVAQQQRDARDRGRSVAPLRPPDDAVIVDTTDKTVDQVVETLFRDVTERAAR